MGDDATVGHTVFSIFSQTAIFFFPIGADILWNAIFVGSFFLDAVSLQCLFWIHVFLDPYVGALLAAIYADIAGGVPAYCSAGHQYMSFFWTLVFYYEHVGCRMVWWKNGVFGFAIAIFLTGLVYPGETAACTVPGLLMSIGTGTVFGAMIVGAFIAVCTPLIAAAMRRGGVKARSVSADGKKD